MNLLAAGLRQPEPQPLLEAQPPALRGWVSVTRLHRPDTWRALAASYSAGLGTPHRAVGAACGLQHYTGRLATAVLGVWVQTGTVLCLDASRWRAWLDEAGHTVTVDARLRPAEHDASLSGTIELIRTHVAPLARAAREAGGITDRLAWGSLATSCAGALGRLQRALDDRTAAERLARAADAVLTDADWGTGRALVTCRTQPGPFGLRLVHERHTCCLIRLGRDHSVCGTCPQQPDSARRAHAHEVAALAGPGRPLTAGFSS